MKPKRIVHIDKEGLKKKSRIILTKATDAGFQDVDFFPHIHPALRPQLLETLLQILS